MHFQKAGHTPIALVGGATGMIGDPSGKSTERNLLNEQTLNKNIQGIKSQLSRFLDFDQSSKNPALLVNNFDWIKGYSLIDFSRDIGKHITVNYMMSKDSVKKRLDSESQVGMSFTEFTYQLLQGYDFLHLYKKFNCTLQMGGSDQWGNITTGTELVRRKANGKAYAITCPLITKADGTKFGKTEGGNIWLDKERTSPYKFYQYWINAGDEEVSKYIRIFTLKSKDEIEALEAQHAQDPGQRILQKELAADITRRVHSQADLETAIAASSLLFGKSSKEAIEALPEAEFLSVFEGVPSAEVSKSDLVDGVSIIDLLSDATAFLNSKGEARRALKENSISVNKAKVAEDYTVTEADLISGKHILLQRGKKNYFLVRCT